MQLKAFIRVKLSPKVFELVNQISMVRYIHEFDDESFIIDVHASTRHTNEFSDVLMLICHHSAYSRSELKNSQLIHVKKGASNVY